MKAARKPGNARTLPYLIGFLFLSAFLSAPAAAQLDPGIGVGPDPALLGPSADKKKDPHPRRLAFAMSLALPTTAWIEVGLSSAGVPGEIEKLLRGGLYRAEIFQLAEMARLAAKPLSEAAALRKKKESTLRKVAAELGVDYDAVYAAAAAAAERAEAYLPEIDRIEPLPKPGAEPPPANRGRP